MAACKPLMLFCLFVLGLILCDPQHQTRVIYGAVKGSVTFPVAAPASFKEILWKKGKYPVIQWEVHSQPDPKPFWPFVGRTSLNTVSGDLSIFKLTQSDKGEYELKSPDVKDDIKFLLKVIESPLKVDMVVPKATVPEKATFRLDCSIVSRTSQDSQFAVAWFSLRTKVGRRKGRPGLEELEEEKEDADPTEQTALLSVGHDGIFGPEGSAWKGRLRFQRLSSLLYRLTVLQARPQDTGSYSCRVEEWLPGLQGAWYRLTEQESAPICVCVLDTGSTLQSVICSNDAFFYFIFCYPFPIFSILIFIIWKQCHHQEPELQQELQKEKQGTPAMDQRAAHQLIPEIPGTPSAQHQPRSPTVLFPLTLALNMPNYNFEANDL